MGLVMQDNGDGTWTFTVADVGTGLCAWLQADQLVGTGTPPRASPAT